MGYRIIIDIYEWEIEMKKMILGALFFVAGFIGVLALSIVAALNPWKYNGITGLRGSLLGTGMMIPFILFFTLSQQNEVLQ
ncbi:hypothetical protein [Brassicibacter mesophilus]|uniref:hypothetical protein n=1 Tax=Brassicibacter mesophilus TaxID=745119 RepID=UPI003D24FA01